MPKLLDVQKLLVGGTVRDVLRLGETETVLVFANGTELVFDGSFDLFVPETGAPASAWVGCMEDWGL